MSRADWQDFTGLSGNPRWTIPAMKQIFLIFTLFFFAGCGTSRISTLNKIQVGMSKSTVLDLVGNPSRSGRVDGTDRWSYDYWVNDLRKTYNVQFSEGTVVKHGVSPK